MLEVGTYKDLPHYSVVGNPQSFYVFITTRRGPGGAVWSGWVNGNLNLYHKLKALKSKKDFKAMCEFLADKRH